MGFDTVSVIEIMRGARDIDVIQKAKEENRVIITNDRDFGWLAVTYKPPGVILLRLRKETMENKIKMIHHIIKKHRDSVYGNIIIATEEKIRIRPL